MRLPFLKKKEPEAIGKGFVPVDRIREMAGRGFSEPEMIDVLRREGFSVDEVDKALTQTLRMGVAGEPVPSAPKAEETALPTLEELTPKLEMPQLPETSLPQEYTQYPTEDYIDYIVQARVAEVAEKVNEFSIRYQELEKRMNAISEQLNEIVKSRSEGQEQILTRIDTFKESFEDINTRVSGLEKVFKETLPALIESVRALSDLVQRMKREA